MSYKQTPIARLCILTTAKVPLHFSLLLYVIIIIIIIIMQTYPGEKFQWSFIIPLLQASISDITQNGGTSSTDDPYAGPECCLTLPAACPDGVGWPDRTTSTIPTVYADLVLTSGSSIDYRAHLCQLRKNIVSAITTYLCPKGQRVWYVYSVLHA